jgi:hypothetical protein
LTQIVAIASAISRSLLSQLPRIVSAINQINALFFAALVVSNALHRTRCVCFPAFHAQRFVWLCFASARFVVSMIGIRTFASSHMCPEARNLIEHLFPTRAYHALGCTYISGRRGTMGGEKSQKKGPRQNIGGAILFLWKLSDRIRWEQLMTLTDCFLGPCACVPAPDSLPRMRQDLQTSP